MLSCSPVWSAVIGSCVNCLGQLLLLVTFRFLFVMLWVLLRMFCQIVLIPVVSMLLFMWLSVDLEISPIA